jgi:hypothetical protein
MRNKIQIYSSKLEHKALSLWDVYNNCHKKKNPVNKNQGWEPIQQKYNANDNTNRHNPKQKPKANNQ